jgi:hypothetical protein
VADDTLDKSEDPIDELVTCGSDKDEDTEPKLLDDSENAANDIELLLLMAATVLVVLLGPASTQYLVFVSQQSASTPQDETYALPIIKFEQSATSGFNVWKSANVMPYASRSQTLSDWTM